MFVIDDTTGELSPLQESAYGSESELQELIARYPQILNGAESNGGRSYALVRREHGTADDLGAGRPPERRSRFRRAQPESARCGASLSDGS